MQSAGLKASWKRCGNRAAEKQLPNPTARKQPRRLPEENHRGGYRMEEGETETEGVEKKTARAATAIHFFVQFPRLLFV